MPPISLEELGLLSTSVDVAKEEDDGKDDKGRVTGSGGVVAILVVLDTSLEVFG